MELSIVVVNYNVCYFLELCLLSVREAIRNIDAEVIIIDNASTDNSRSYLGPRFPDMKFEWLENNIGFGAACNYGAGLATGKSILFLNPDTIIPEDSLQTCLEFMRTHKDCGALGVQMIDGSGSYLPESKRNLPTAKRSFFKMSGLHKLSKPKFYNDYYANQVANDAIGEVEVLSGAFLWISEKAMSLTKGFDTDFFMYGEDIDLSYRILKGGLKNYYLGNVSIIHFKGESSKNHTKAYRKHFYNAMKLFVHKHYSSGIKKWVMLSGINMASVWKPLPKKGKFLKPRQVLAVSSTVIPENLLKSFAPASIMPYAVQSHADEKLLHENYNQLIVQSSSDSILWIFPLSVNLIIECMKAAKAKVHHFFTHELSDAIISSNDRSAFGDVVIKKKIE